MSASTSRLAGSRSSIAPALRFSQWPSEVGEEAARPGDAALEEADAQLREAAGDAAEEQRLAERLVAERRDRRRGCRRSSRSSASPGGAAPRCATRARRRARRTRPRTGRSRSRCRGRTCRGGTGTARRRRAAASRGRRSTTLRKPELARPRTRARRWRGRASCIGTSAPTSMRSAYGANTPAWMRFTARQSTAGELGIGRVEEREAHRRVQDRDVDPELVEALVAAARGRCDVARSRTLRVGQPHHDGIASTARARRSGDRSASTDDVSVGTTPLAR